VGAILKAELVVLSCDAWVVRGFVALWGSHDRCGDTSRARCAFLSLSSLDDVIGMPRVSAIEI
jgi:hypothetical protein